MDWAQAASALLPYRFSWLAVLFFGLAALAYGRGIRVLSEQGEPVSRWRQLAFWVGLALAYGVMHTRFDYYAQFMFFIHRGQHLVLHHLAPLLIALANPWRALAAGVPESRFKAFLGSVLGSAPVRWGYRVLQFPPVAAFLFVGLIFFWLQPEVHFYAMLSEPRYLLMNWSMWLDGLLFWWLILDPRSPLKAGTLGFGKRILLIWAVTVPQLALGARIAVSKTPLFDVYEVCGRAWPIDPMNDQLLGGILTWIPPGMMAVIAMLIVLRRLLHQGETRPLATQGDTP
ncbi:cytochrome c oxidase assembly protein [Saccharospirillum salsuginis]|uniref:Cytochrome c oxidase assembly protein n=1 Tax=Saccharospirillum salsuginis TaxID=418750 RepID=A0A918NC42_9GAMM|nr:cytochrome c oxidase assembly protein [Saccharospirillum salsuginis]GGX56882.1 hypothetical protein GCM10007392_25440 [Saccharospirillum salsuginis]